jgi:hypothetical protein
VAIVAGAAVLFTGIDPVMVTLVVGNFGDVFMVKVARARNARLSIISTISRGAN